MGPKCIMYINMKNCFPLHIISLTGFDSLEIMSDRDHINAFQQFCGKVSGSSRSTAQLFHAGVLTQGFSPLMSLKILIRGMVVAYFVRLRR